MLLLVLFARRLYRRQPIVFVISAGTLLLSVVVHSANLWEFLAAENYSGRFSVWVLPIAYLATGYLTDMWRETGKMAKGLAIAVLSAAITVSVASALGNWPYRATWLSRQFLGTNSMPVEWERFDEVARARVWEPRFSLPIDSVASLPRNIARMTGYLQPDLVEGASPINQRMSNGFATWWFALLVVGVNRFFVVAVVGAMAVSIVLLARGLWMRAAPGVCGEKTGQSAGPAIGHRAWLS